MLLLCHGVFYIQVYGIQNGNARQVARTIRFCCLKDRKIAPQWIQLESMLIGKLFYFYFHFFAGRTYIIAAIGLLKSIYICDFECQRILQKSNTNTQTHIKREAEKEKKKEKIYKMESEHVSKFHFFTLVYFLAVCRAFFYPFSF